MEMASNEHQAAGGSPNDLGGDAIRDAQPLGRLTGHALADGYADVRGWRVDATDGSALGTVSELLVDTRTLRVTHLELALHEDDDAGDPPSHARVPIEAVRIDDRARRVKIGSITDMGRAPAADREVRLPIVVREGQREAKRYRPPRSSRSD
jgi:sporulation protein YlmC with PRC-barrel domain